jgi:putative ABC transport system permease protein
MTLPTALRPRWRKVFSDLWGSKARSLLVIASFTIGLFAVGLILSMNVIITADMRTGYAAINPANIHFFVSPFDLDLVEHLRREPGVRQAEGVRLLSLRAQTTPDQWDPIEIKAIPDIDELAINQVSLVAGDWPPLDRQLVVDRYKLPDLNAEIGDLIPIELPSGKIRYLELVGVIHDQTIGATDPGGFFLSPLQGYITFETLDWLEQSETLNNLVVTAEAHPNELERLRELANRLGAEIEDTGATVYSSAVRAAEDHPNRVYVQAISIVLIMLGLLIVFLSAFLVTTTLSALLSQQVHQIGVMKAIGAQRLQIMSIYMTLIFVYGIVAFAIALPLSSRGAYLLLEFLGGQINMVLQGYRVVPMAVVVQLVLALILPQAAGFLPILRGTRISTVEALSGYSQAHPPRKGPIDRFLQRLRGVSRPTLISLRNTFRRKGRLTLTLFTLTLGGAVFIATFNVQRSLTSYIDRIGSYFLADVNLSLTGYERISEIQDILAEVPGVTKVEGWAAARGEIVLPDGSVGESVNILAPPAGSEFVEPKLLQGRWLQKGDEAAVAVNERFKDLFPDLQAGQTVRLKIAGDEIDLVVVGFFQLAGRSSGYLAYANYEYLSILIHAANKANTFRIDAAGENLTLAQQEAIGKLIEKAVEARGYSVTEISAGRSLTATTADGLNILTGFLLIMASLIAIIGSIGLTGTMSLNVLERTREIGIMRSIGATDRAITSMVMIEGMLIGLMSWLFGALLSVPIGSLMSNAINLSLFGAPAEFNLTPIGVSLWLGLVLALSTLASVGPARNATRLTIREVLAYE